MNLNCSWNTPWVATRGLWSCRALSGRVGGFVRTQHRGWWWTLIHRELIYDLGGGLLATDLSRCWVHVRSKLRVVWLKGSYWRQTRVRGCTDTPHSYRIFNRISVLFDFFVFYSFFFNLGCQLADWKSRVYATTIFLKGVINKLVLFLKATASLQELENEV